MILLCQKQVGFFTSMHKILLYHIYQRIQIAHWVSWWQRKPRGEMQLKKCLTEIAWGTKHPQLQHSAMMFLPSQAPNIISGMEYQRKREVVDMGLTAEECEARAIFSVRPAWTLLFAIVPTHTKNKYSCANLPNVSVWELHYRSCVKATKVMQFILYARSINEHLNIHTIKTANC